MFEYVDDLMPCEAIIPSSDEELLLRQIGDHVWDDVNRIPTDLAFAPQGSDSRKPSFSRGEDPQASRDWHQKNAKSPSLGVWAVTAQEAARAGVGLRAVDDSGCPENGEVRAPHHAYLDYRGLNKQERAQARKYLLLAAKRRKELLTEDIGHHSQMSS